MREYWIVPGSEDNWRQSLLSKGIWGLESNVYKKIYWLAVKPDDLILFYVTGKIKGVIGYGVVRSKFYQDIPLWTAEIKEGKVKWPLRFEFDIDFILDREKWEDSKFSIPGGGSFRQPLILKSWDEIKPIIDYLNPGAAEDILNENNIRIKTDLIEISSPSHDEIKRLIVEIGKLQGYIASPEYQMGPNRLDAVWRRLPESVPTYVFEVQIGGDIYHALGKLKHAFDIWNSRIFLVASINDLNIVNQLLSGTFHEIKPFLKFIEIEKIQNLYKAKRNIYEIEREVGILP